MIIVPQEESEFSVLFTVIHGTFLRMVWLNNSLVDLIKRNDCRRPG